MSKLVFARPLVALTLLFAPVAAQAHHDGTHHGREDTAPAAEAAVPAATLGDLTVENPWSRATPPMANVAAGYLVIRNAGAEAAHLLAASSTAVDHVELHLMTMENDVMTMREVEEGLEIPAGGSVELAPRGYHLMLIGLAEPLQEGERVPLTLRFETGTIETELAVQSMGARTAPAGHGGH